MYVCVFWLESCECSFWKCDLIKSNSIGVWCRRCRYDHILKWELFQLADLDTYQGLLKLLFMKELERIVKSYEAYRQALLTELDNRKQRQQWYAQHHSKNFPPNA